MSWSHLRRRRTGMKGWVLVAAVAFSVLVSVASVALTVFVVVKVLQWMGVI